MKKYVFLCAAALSFALPALAEDGTIQYQPDGSQFEDKADHYNNQSSIVPDTVPDTVHHNTASGQIKADQAKLKQDEADMQAHQQHRQEQRQKDDQALHNSGTPPIATQ